MTLTKSEFNRQCLEFVLACRKCDEDWKLVKCGTGGELRDFDHSASGSGCDLDRMQLMLAKRELKIKPQCNSLQSLEYNVIYSESYEVPVLYLDSSNQDGSPVSFDEWISRDLLLEQDSFGQVVSQVEHPFTFRPYYMIHPCRTKDFMQVHSANNGSKYYLVCWLSTVATLIGLKVNLRLADVLKL